MAKLRPITLTPGVELVSSMRSIGYSVEVAIADLIDNSIAALASEISVRFSSNDSGYVEISDNGIGMDRQTLLKAMQMAGLPESRSIADLGRFGLGLKTASLSQALVLIVVSKTKDGPIVGLSWDLNHVKQSQRWEVLELSQKEIDDLPFIGELKYRESGTKVYWRDLDQLSLGCDSLDEGLSKAVQNVRNHVALVFHRFLQRPLNALNILVNDQIIAGVDPFLLSNTKTQRTQPDKIRYDGFTAKVVFYTLPHRSMLSPAELRRDDLNSQMADRQGFYVYRNERLIIAGDWFGLVKKGEVTKLTRVQVDIDPTQDYLWKLDVLKSRVSAPRSFKGAVRPLLFPTVERAKRVHTFRGNRQVSSDVARFWNRLENREGEIYYSVNADHPSISSFAQNLDTDQSREFRSLLDMIGMMLPTYDVYLSQVAEQASERPLVGDEALLIHAQKLDEFGILPKTHNELLRVLQVLEPFSEVSDLPRWIAQYQKTRIFDE